MFLTKSQKEEISKHKLKKVFQQNTNGRTHYTSVFNRNAFFPDLIKQLDGWIDKLHYLKNLSKKTNVIFLKKILDCSESLKHVWLSKHRIKATLWRAVVRSSILWTTGRCKMGALKLDPVK